MSEKIKFVLNGCDISFFAEAPADITLKQLLEQCDKIKPDYCACGICSYEREGIDETYLPELIIGYDNIIKANTDASCEIVEDWGEINECGRKEEIHKRVTEAGHITIASSKTG